VTTHTICIEGHGKFQLTAADFDVCMMRHLPASINQLRQLILDWTGMDYSDVHTVFELLAIIADITRPVSGFDSDPAMATTR
jgi:hypothetical protein